MNFFLKYLKDFKQKVSKQNRNLVQVLFFGLKCKRVFKKNVYSQKSTLMTFKCLFFPVCQRMMLETMQMPTPMHSRRGWYHDTGSVICKPEPATLSQLSLSRIVIPSEVGVASPTLDFKRHPFSFYYLSFLSATTNNSTSTETNPSSLSRDPIAQNCSQRKKKECKKFMSDKIPPSGNCTRDYLLVPPF